MIDKFAAEVGDRNPFKVKRSCPQPWGLGDKLSFSSLLFNSCSAPPKGKVLRSASLEEELLFSSPEGESPSKRFEGRRTPVQLPRRGKSFKALRRKKNSCSAPPKGKVLRSASKEEELLFSSPEGDRTNGHTDNDRSTD